MTPNDYGKYEGAQQVCNIQININIIRINNSNNINDTAGHT